MKLSRANLAKRTPMTKPGKSVSGMKPKHKPSRLSPQTKAVLEHLRDLCLAQQEKLREGCRIEACNDRYEDAFVSDRQAVACGGLALWLRNIINNGVMPEKGPC